MGVRKEKSDYDDLVWSGLEGTPAFFDEFLSSAARNMIKEKILIEKTGKNFQGQVELYQ